MARHHTYTRTITSAALLCMTAATTIACGGTALSGSSTCADFMNATRDQQDQIINSLAVKYHRPDYTTPLGRPDVPYFCATHAQTTLEQFFSGKTN